MGLSKTELKNLVKETVQELLADKDFIDSIAKKVSDKVADLEKCINKECEKIVILEENAAQHKTKIDRIEEDVRECDQKVVILESRIDQLMQNEKLKNVIIHGLDVSGEDDILQQVMRLINNVVKIEVNNDDITACYRVGNSAARYHPIIVKFVSQNKRNAVLAKRGNLKGTKAGITEDLTKRRLSLYKKAQELFNRKFVFTRNGHIFVKVGEVKHKIRNEEDLQRIDI